MFPLKVGFVDIGANLTDAMFAGWYHDKQYHAPDVAQVVDRAVLAGLRAIIVTGGSLEESRAAIQLATDQNHRLASANCALRCYATVGCHPTRSCEMAQGVQGYMEGLRQLLKIHRAPAGCVVAVGECGLDYDRLHFSSKEHQLAGFAAQFALAEEFSLPMFLHSRNCSEDFVRLVGENRHRMPKGGVVHSFTGSAVEAEAYLKLGLYIGINGCSLKSEENLAVLRQSIPTSRLLLETDAPWCDIRDTHASTALLKSLGTASPSELFLSKTFPPKCKKEKFVTGAMVKGRCEPCQILSVFDVVFAIKGLSDREKLAEEIMRNAHDVFFSASNSSVVQ